jgi:hypothetical protein
LTHPSGKLWPLWLFPVLCFVAGAAYLDAMTSGAQAAGGDGFFGQLVLLWALLAVPGYGLTVVLLRRRLKGLPTSRIALIALLASALTALVFSLCLLALGNRKLNDHWHSVSPVVLLLIPVVSPAIGLCAGYVLIRQWRRGSAMQAG